jgi:hypothetical protein
MGTKTYNNYEDLLTFTRASKGHALRPVSYGSELVTNGDFATDSDWTKGTGWSISGGVAVHTGATAGYLTQANVTEAGKLYQVTLDITALASGKSVQIWDTSGGNILLTFDGTGSVSGNFVAKSTTLHIRESASAECTIDNVSVKEVTFDQPDGTLTLFEHPNNIPRVEWDAQRNRLGLLVEEARTNLMLYSEDFSQANWDKNNTSITSGTAVSPTGLQTADTLTATSTGNFRYIERGVSLTQNETYTFSVYLKYTDTQWVWLLGETSANTFFWFDIQNGVIGGSGGSTGNPFTGESYSHTIQDVGNGWYRCSITFTKSSASGTEEVGFGLANADVNTNATLNQTCLAYGPQLEVGSFPTSYIKTTGATATRSADIASINTADFGYNSAEGTVVCEFNIKYDDGGSGFPRVWEIGNSSSSADRINVYIGEQYGTLSFGINTNTASVAGNNLKVGTGGSVQSTVAMGWAKDNVGVSDDGDSALTDSNADILPTAFSRNRLKIGGAANTASDNISGHIKSIKYYPRKLTNAQIEDLSS